MSRFLPRKQSWSLQTKILPNRLRKEISLILDQSQASTQLENLFLFFQIFLFSHLALMRYCARLMLAGVPVMVIWRSDDPSMALAILICAPDIWRISLILVPWRPIMQPISWEGNGGWTQYGGTSDRRMCCEGNHAASHPTQKLFGQILKFLGQSFFIDPFVSVAMVASIHIHTFGYMYLLAYII